MAKRKQYDWEAIEREYGLGQKSLRVLSAEFGPAPGTISKRAKKYRWVQDKSAEVRQKTQAALIKETVGNTDGNTPTPEDVERAVKTNVEVVRQHRSLIGRTISLADKLLAEYQGEKKIDPKVDNRVFLSITQGLAKIIPLERQAFNIDESKGSETIEDLIRRVNGKG
jgi:hypothetical protein